MIRIKIDDIASYLDDLDITYRDILSLQKEMHSLISRIKQQADQALTNNEAYLKLANQDCFNISSAEMSNTSAINNLESKISANGKRISQDIAALKNKNTKPEKRTQIKDEIPQLEEEIEKMGSKIESIKAKNQKLEKIREDIEKEIKRLQNSREKIQKELHYFEKDVEKFERSYRINLNHLSNVWNKAKNCYDYANNAISTLCRTFDLSNTDTLELDDTYVLDSLAYAFKKCKMNVSDKLYKIQGQNKELRYMLGDSVTDEVNKIVTNISSSIEEMTDVFDDYYSSLDKAKQELDNYVNNSKM